MRLFTQTLCQQYLLLLSGAVEAYVFFKLFSLKIQFAKQRLKQAFLQVKFTSQFSQISFQIGGILRNIGNL